MSTKSKCWLNLNCVTKSLRTLETVSYAITDPQMSVRSKLVSTRETTMMVKLWRSPQLSWWAWTLLGRDFLVEVHLFLITSAFSVFCTCFESSTLDILCTQTLTQTWTCMLTKIQWLKIIQHHIVTHVGPGVVLLDEDNHCHRGIWNWNKVLLCEQQKSWMTGNN